MRALAFARVSSDCATASEIRLSASTRADQDRGMRRVVPPSAASERGLNAAGYIVREGSLSQISPAFRPAVDDARRRIAHSFRHLLHSAYLYGSVPRGTAAPGRSDLDILLVLRSELTDADRAEAGRIEAALHDRHPAIDGTGIVLFSARRILSPAERHDLGFFLACLCTPLIGEDLAPLLPWYRPTRGLARETNGDLRLFLDRWRRSADSGCGLDRLFRQVGRKLVRTGFTLVMPRWNGWTSDLDVSADVFGSYYPERAGQMRKAVTLARVSARAAGRPVCCLPAPPDPDGLRLLLDDLGPWLAGEYEREIGLKTPRK
jgi:predicted nucleotidyltransferase